MGQTASQSSGGGETASSGRDQRATSQRRRQDREESADSSDDERRKPKGKDKGRTTENDQRAAPPVVYVSNEDAAHNGAITIEMMGDNHVDDELLPTLDERAQRIVDERRRREELLSKKKELHEEYPILQGSMCSGSNELNYFVYALVKYAFYICVMIAIVYIKTKHYPLSECYFVDGRCLYKDSNVICFPIADQSCSNACSGDPFGSYFDKGCVLPTNGSITCIEDFTRNCVEKTTCPQSNGQNMRATYKNVQIVHGIAMGIDFFLLPCLFFANFWHGSAFLRLNFIKKLALFYIKVWLLQSRLLWYCSLGILIHMAVIYAKNYKICEEALTPEGDKYLLFDDAIILITCLFAFQFITIVLGTYMRSNRRLRGYTTTISNDAEITLPVICTCKTCRDSTKPRWCRSVFIDFLSLENCVGCFCNFCSRTIDIFCCLTFEIIGYALDEFYTNRHFIGP